jgi:hypothetical protein
MILRFAIDLLLWLLLWVAGWAVFGYMLRRGIDYVKRFPVTCAYFITISIVIAVLFRTRLAPVAANFTPAPLVVLAFVYVVTIALYRVAHLRLARPQQLIERNPYELFLTLDYRYLLSKSFELLYQQVMIVLLILSIHDLTPALLHVVVIYGIVFPLAHLPIYPFIGTNEKTFRVFYLVASVVSAILFPVLILKVDFGFVYTYAMHLSFYTLAALVLWAKPLRSNPKPDIG